MALEQGWREGPGRPEDGLSSRILVSRWKDDQTGTHHHFDPPNDNFSVVAVALRIAHARLTVGDQVVHDGKLGPGVAAFSPAGLPSSVEFRSPSDFLHLFIPRARLDRIAQDIEEEASSCCVGQAFVLPADAIIERLAWLLLTSGDDQSWASAACLDSVAQAIVTRLLHARRIVGLRDGYRGLVKWRLKRVLDFIETRLSEPLLLEDLAQCAGLSRMHFAAQFREATGLRPHEYLLSRRIQFAQELLRTTTMPLVEVALNVGFQTQAHFTTVFGRILGQTPGRWREAQRF